MRSANARSIAELCARPCESRSCALQSIHNKPSTQPRSKVPPICSSFRVNVAENQ